MNLEHVSDRNLSKILAGLVLLLLGLSVGCGQPQSLDDQIESEFVRLLARGTPPNLKVGAFYSFDTSKALQRGETLRQKLVPAQIPLIGKYRSDDVSTYEVHIGLASRSGIDFFIFSRKVGDFDELAYEVFTGASNLSDMKFCFQLSPGSEELDLELERLVKEFERPQYMKIEGRPLVVFAKGFAKEEVGKAVIRLRAVEGGVFLVCDAMDWDRQSIDKSWALKEFDAVTNSDFMVSSPPELGGYGMTSKCIESINKELFRFKQGLPTGVSFVPTVIPGFNERGESPRSPRNVIPRQWSISPGAKTFFHKALRGYAGPAVDETCPILFVRSWNDWGEDSAIEPLKLAAPTSRDVEGGVLCGGFKYEGVVFKDLAQLRDSLVSVTGRVVSLDGVPLGGQPVTAWKERETVAIVRSNQGGHFRFPRGEMKAGLYQVGLSQEASVDVLIKPLRSVAGLRFVSDEPETGESAELSLDPKLPVLLQARDSILDHDSVRGAKRKIGAFEWTGPPEDAASPLPRSLVRHLDPERSVFETGAATGGQSLRLAALVKKGVPVYSAESNPGRYRFLKANAIANPESGVKPLFYSIGARLGASPDGSGGLVERRSLDSFPLPELGLVWIKESDQVFPILSGARQTLEKTSPVVVFPSVQKDFEELKGLLVGYGYQWKRGDADSWVALPLGAGGDRFRRAVGEGFHRLTSTGFYEPEYDAGVSFVWSEGKVSELQLPVPKPGKGDYRLALRARSLPSLAPQVVEVALNERPLGSVTLGRDWHGFILEIPAGTLRPGQNTLRFDYPGARKPTSNDSARGDARELAMALSAFWLAPGR